METVIAKLLQDFEQGKMNRRQLIQSLSVAAAAAAGMATPARAAGKPLEALYVNHISYQVNDYKKVRDFYVDLMGLTEGERPAFPFRGYWLYLGGIPVIHLVEASDTAGEGTHTLRDRAIAPGSCEPAHA